jgi:hypothetical protein
MSKQLNEPITENGIRITNFFNGRLLTANDLKTDQEAGRSQRWQLGRAIGDGIIEGFEVNLMSAGTPTTLPVVGVTKGLAINRKGQILSLPNDDAVSLVRSVDRPPPEAGIFGECGVLTSTFSNLDRGAYLLVVGPASGFWEKAPMRNVQPNGAASGCGSKFAVEGVQFDLLKLDIDSMTAISAATRTEVRTLMTQGDVVSLSRLRNILAHLCFGTEELRSLALDPFKQASGKSAFADYGAVDFMRQRGEITDCQVPLALVYWAGGSVRFLDMWSTRRGVTPGETTKRWPPLLGERRSGEGEAMIRQFQEHAESLKVDHPFPDLFIARNHFRYLPPAGILSLRTPTRKGFSLNTFFSGVVSRRVPEFIDGALLRALFCEAVNYQPIDLTRDEMIWLYKVRQQEGGPDGGTPGQPYVVFASPHVPYKATARFDVSRWELSNYSRGEDCQV